MRQNVRASSEAWFSIFVKMNAILYEMSACPWKFASVILCCIWSDFERHWDRDLSFLFNFHMLMAILHFVFRAGQMNQVVQLIPYWSTNLFGLHTAADMANRRERERWRKKETSTGHLGPESYQCKCTIYMSNILLLEFHLWVTLINEFI